MKISVGVKAHLNKPWIRLLGTPKLRWMPSSSRDKRITSNH